VVNNLSKRESDESNNPEVIKKSLDDIVQKLDQDADASKSWSSSIEENKEEWEALKKKIHDRQKALKQLVADKRAGIIGMNEFEGKYKILQDELTKLEFAVYNMRLGTKIQ
jgi:chromosome segregation ATPase